MTEAWKSPPAAPAVPPADAPRASTAGGPTVANLPATAVSSTPIVRINGSPLSRKQFVEVLLRGHGLALLEELIVHQTTEPTPVQARAMELLEVYPVEGN